MTTFTFKITKTAKFIQARVAFYFIQYIAPVAKQFSFLRNVDVYKILVFFSLSIYRVIG